MEKRKTNFENWLKINRYLLIDGMYVNNKGLVRSKDFLYRKYKKDPYISHK